MIISKITFRNLLPREKTKGCLIALTGRGVPSEWMEKFSHVTGLSRTLKVAIEPRRLVWYPQPNGVQDQTLAVEGLKDAVEELEKTVDFVKKSHDFKDEEIAILGFSAGAVVALEFATQKNRNLLATISIAGAILEPWTIKKATNNSPIFLRHNLNDFCFDWEERYLPMKDQLKKKGYNLVLQESKWGGHDITKEDAEMVGHFLGQLLNYDNKELFVSSGTFF